MKGAVLALISASFLAGCTTLGAKQPSQMAMWRLDCGSFDIENLEGRGHVVMPTSCYLIRHGNDYLMFDAGLDTGLIGHPDVQTTQTVSLDRSMADQFAAIGIDPAKVTTLVVSHYHGDHTGQASLFPNAKLVIGAGDAAVLRKESDHGGTLAPWLTGERRVEEISADRNLTSNGKLKVLFTPGHTPGHLSLLVRLAGGNYILTGDLVHERRQLASREPSGNHVDKVRGKAEIERVIALATAEHAMIVVGHERDDVGLLPAFPKAAE